MRYAILIYDENTANPSPEPPSPEVFGEVMSAYNGYTQMLKDKGVYQAGEALQPDHHRDVDPDQGRPDHHDRRPVRRDEGGARRLLHHRGQGSRRGARATARSAPARASARRSRSGR